MADRGAINHAPSRVRSVSAAGAGGTIAGTVTAADGNPLGIVAELFSERYRLVVATTEVASDGTYTFRYARPGRYEIRFRHPTRKYRSRVVHVGVDEFRIDSKPNQFQTLGMTVDGRFRCSDPAATFAVIAGALPVGVTLNANGTLNGSLTAGGRFFCVVRATSGTSTDVITWKGKVDAFLVGVGSASGQDSAFAQRVVGVGAVDDAHSFDYIEEAVARNPQNVTNLFTVDRLGARTIAVAQNASQNFRLSEDNGKTFIEFTIRATGETLAILGGFWAFGDRDTGSLVNSRGSTGGPAIVYDNETRLAGVLASPIGSIFLGNIANTGGQNLVGLSSGDECAQSTDGGLNWSLGPPVALNASTSMYNAGALLQLDGVVMCVLTDAGGAAANRYIRKSTDNGSTWTTKFTFTGTFSTSEFGHSLAGGDGNWIAFTSGSSGAVKMAYSTDDGETWTQTTPPVGEYGGTRGKNAVASYNRHSSQYLLCDATSGLLWYSSTFGASWSAVLHPFQSATPFMFAMSTYPTDDL